MSQSQITQNMKKKKTEQEPSPSKPIPIKPSLREQKISPQFIMKLLAEEQRCQKQMSEQNILALLNNYKKLIQYYSIKQDAIAVYFTQKMQNLISCQTAIETFDKTRQTMTMSMAEEAASQINVSDFKQVVPSSSKYDIDAKKKERAKKVQIFMEVKRTQKRSNAKNILNKYYEECLSNNALVMTEIHLQKLDLQNRLKAIHERSQKMECEGQETEVQRKTSLTVYIS